MKIIIGSGKVANIIKNAEDIVLTHQEIEISDTHSVEQALSKLPNGSVIINTAAKINLEWCEENKNEAYKVNVEGARIVAEQCAKNNHHLIHISSGCIFDGMETEKFYHENDEPTPAAWYAETKAVADQKIMSIGYDKITIVRPRQLISAVPHITNMITKFMSIKEGEFIDSKNSITCIEDMKDMIDHIVHKELYGIYNLANVGWLSPYQIACKIKSKLSPGMDVKKINYNDYISKINVKRVNTLLSVSKISSTGYIPRNAMSALNWCIDNYGKTK